MTETGRAGAVTGATGEQETVLVVDDEPALREVYGRSLESTFDVVTAGTGKAALTAIDDQVEAVVLDRRMPGLSGDDVVRRLRERGNDVPIAIVSGADPGMDIVDLPIDEYLTKPASIGTLNERVEALVRRPDLSEREREHARLTAKKATLEDTTIGDSVDEAQAELRNRLEALEANSDELPRSDTETDRSGTVT